MKLSALILVSFLLSFAACSRYAIEHPIVARCDAPAEDDLRLRWLGAAGIYLTDGETKILIDPFVSRRTATMGMILRNRPLEPDTRQINALARRLGPVDAIIVTHAHYDHVMDVAGLAGRTGAKVYGSRTARHIVVGHGLSGDRFQITTSGDLLQIGDMSIAVRPGAHGRVVSGHVPWTGKLTTNLWSPAPASAYRMGEIMALQIDHPQARLLYSGSAGAVEDVFSPPPADGRPVVSIASVAGWAKSQDYLRRVVTDPGASSVIPVHFDDLFDAQPVHRPEKAHSPMRIGKPSEYAAFVEQVVTLPGEPYFAPLPHDLFSGKQDRSLCAIPIKPQ